VTTKKSSKSVKNMYRNRDNIFWWNWEDRNSCFCLYLP